MTRGWIPTSIAIAAVAVLVGAGLLLNHDFETKSVGGTHATGPGFWPNELELGEHALYSEIPFSAKFLNPTGAPVRIAQVQTACGCTVLETEAFVGSLIQPGDALELKGELRVGSLIGEHSKGIDVLLESGAVHTLFLKFSGFETYRYSPRFLRFAEINLDDDESATQSVIFSSAGVSVLPPPEVDSPWLEAALLPRGNGEVEIVVHIAKRNLAAGKSYGRVSLRTDDENRPTFSIPVRVEAVSHLRPVPAHVFLAAASEKSIVFVTNEGFHAKVARASSNDESVSATIHSDGRSVLVRWDGSALGEAAVVSVEDEDGHQAKVFVWPIR